MSGAMKCYYMARSVTCVEVEVGVAGEREEGGGRLCCILDTRLLNGFRMSG